MALLRGRITDPHSAEDLAQDTLLRAYKALDSFDTSRPFWPWLRKIADNLVIDYLRSGQRRTFPVDPAVLASNDEQSCPVDGGDALSDRTLLVAAMRELDPRQRQALALRYLYDRTATEVAAALGMKLNSTVKLLSRGLTKLEGHGKRLADGRTGLAAPLLWPYWRLRERVVRMRAAAASAPQAAAGAAEAMLVSAASTAAAAAAVALAGLLVASAAVPVAEDPAHPMLRRPSSEQVAVVASSSPDLTNPPPSAPGRRDGASPTSTREVAAVALASEAAGMDRPVVEARSEIATEEDTTWVVTEIDRPNPLHEDGSSGGQGAVEIPCEGPVSRRLCETLATLP